MNLGGLVIDLADNRYGVLPTELWPCGTFWLIISASFCWIAIDNEDTISGA